MLPAPNGNGTPPGPIARLFASVVGLVLSLIVIGVVVAIAIIAIPAAIAIVVIVGVVLVAALVVFVVRAKLRRAFGSGPENVRDQRENVRVRMPGGARDVVDSEPRDKSAGG